MANVTNPEPNKKWIADLDSFKAGIGHEGQLVEKNGVVTFVRRTWDLTPVGARHVADSNDYDEWMTWENDCQNNPQKYADHLFNHFTSEAYANGF